MACLGLRELLNLRYLPPLALKNLGLLGKYQRFEGGGGGGWVVFGPSMIFNMVRGQSWPFE